VCSSRASLSDAADDRNAGFAVNRPCKYGRTICDPNYILNTDQFKLNVVGIMSRFGDRCVYLQLDKTRRPHLPCRQGMATGVALEPQLTACGDSFC